jgi:predicted kinase
MIILRGLPGSGKSRFASPLESEGWNVASADRYEGLYTYHPDGSVTVDDPSKFDPAHGASYLAAIEALRGGQNVIVDNTNLSTEEVVPYVAIAQAFRAEVLILTVAVDPETAFARNTHGVPRSVFFGSEERPGGMVAAFAGFEAPYHWQFLPWLTSLTLNAHQVAPSALAAWVGQD